MYPSIQHESTPIFCTSVRISQITDKSVESKDAHPKSSFLSVHDNFGIEKNMHISIKNLGLLLLFLGSLAGVGLSIWWLAGEGGREPVVALVAAILVVGSTAYGIDWRNLFITNSEHDLEIFRKGDEFLPESTVRLVVEDVTNAHCRSALELDMCDRFHFFCNEHGNAFLSNALQQSRAKFNSALDALGNYTAVHFFSIGNDRFKLYPELLSELEIGKPGNYERYDRHRQELRKLSDVVNLTYRQYRQLVKKRLKT